MNLDSLLKKLELSSFHRFLVAACVMLVLLAATPSSSAVERQKLRGHVPVAAARAKAVGRLPATNRLDLVIGLPLRNREALTQVLEQIYDPASPNYRKYLTPDQFAERFGPKAEDYQKLIAFAKARGLTVTGTHPNRTLLDVNGTVADIEKTFRLSLQVYPHPLEARTFYAPDLNPAPDLDVPLLAIDGLDNVILPRPMNLKKSAAPFSAASARPLATGSGPNKTFIGKDFRAAYAPGVKLTGAGQSVGLFELDNYYPNDVIQYASQAGLPNVPIRCVLLNGVTGRPGYNNVEVALDIDMAVAMAPGLSEVIVYHGRNPNDILNRMATDNQAKQLSSSWSFGNQSDPIREQIFQQMAAQGQSMFQASGDWGAYAGAAAAPADDPFVTAVGGTALTTTGPGGAWVDETVWFGTGGGISTTFSIPGWQRGVSTSTNQGSATMRNVPDVAALSDGVIWIIANNGENMFVGGTSAAAPLWAGFAALINEQAAIEGKPSVGFLNPALYAIGQGPNAGSCLHDVTVGNNTHSGSPNKYYATPGYDLCTGLGTPNGSNLITALLTSPDALRISPTMNYAASGPVQGPFSPSTQTYLLTNAGSASLEWSVANSTSWLDISSRSGTLLPGGPAATVTLSLNAAAADLPAGNYETTVWFTNLNNLVGQSRRVILSVVTPPLITAQPANQAVLEGATATFTAQTATNALLFFQWQRINGSERINLVDSDKFSGCLTPSLTISNVSPKDVGAYSLLVSNAAGTIFSSSASLTLIPSGPVIAIQPANQTSVPGQTVMLSVKAVGNQPISYQWRTGGTNLVDIGKYVGSRTSTLVISNVSPADSLAYSVLVSNALGFATSDDANLTVTPVTAPEITLTSLHLFSGGADGANPNGLVQGTDGNLYGTAQNGGLSSAGTVFRVTPNGECVGLYSFSGGADGANPWAAMVPGSDGKLYGTTYQGGTNDYGTVFKTSLDGELSTLASLKAADGALLFSSLAANGDGSFYSTAYQGGTNHYGTVFKVTADGTLTTLYHFAGEQDGSFPYAGLVKGADGFFYGTTFKGGAGQRGTVFKVSTNGAVTTLVLFNNTNGAFPFAGLTRGTDGNFYGATANGGSRDAGTLFRVTPEGVLTSLYAFTGGADGGRPAATLLAGSDGNFYGTTTYGGAYQKGTVFRMVPDGTVTTIATFTGYNGANPDAPLTEGANGFIYGTTRNGGADEQGTLFRLSVTSLPQITGQPASQSVFQGANVVLDVAAVGSSPLSYQWRKEGVALKDAANVFGSTTRTLVLSNVSLASSGTYSVFITNTLGSALSAGASLQVTSSPPIIATQPLSQTVTPGTTAKFVVVALGNFPLNYRWRVNGIDLTDGGKISGSGTSTLTVSNVTEANNGSYSVVVSNELGVVPSAEALLEVIPVSAEGTRFTTLHWFSGGTNGHTPNGLIQGTDGALYGTTVYGGLNRISGTVFRLTTNGVLTTLASLGGTNGSAPRAGLVQGVDGHFYGTTKHGGDLDGGAIFKMSADGLLTPLHSFTGETDGAYPTAAMIQGSDGNFYGTTADGSPFWQGTVFQLTPDGTFTTLYSFTNGADGAVPVGSLVQGADGDFYGMTAGGEFRDGNIFKITASGNLTTLYSFTDGTDGSAPVGALVLGSDGNFYGAAKHNTIHGYDFYGTLFKFSPEGTLTTLYALNNTDGFYPNAGLIEGSDGNFYGTTDTDAKAGYGTLFRITPQGTLTTLVWFDGFDTGGHPASALVQGQDGHLYGTTTTGGPEGHGTIFRLAMTGAPQFTSQPMSQAVVEGANVLFNIAVSGAPSLHYQWQRNGTNLIDGNHVFGSTNRVLTLANVSPSDQGTYSVIVSNALGSVASSGALLKTFTQPVFQTARHANGALQLSWKATSGQKYRLQYKPALTATNWINLGALVTATNETLTASDPISTNSQRFYRVVLFPQAQ